MTVKGGKITAVNFNHTKADVTLKTNDQQYIKAMLAKKNRMNPVKYTKLLTDSLLQKQDTAKVDAVTNAISSSKIFKIFAAKLIENAKKGDTSVDVR